MLKNSLLYLSLFIVFVSCNSDEDQISIQFDKLYKIIFEQHVDAIGTPIQPFEIIFDVNGTYSRTEFTILNYPWLINQENDRTLLFIDDLQGEWSIKDGNIELTDTEIIKYHCKTMWDKDVDCNISPEKIPLATLERFKNFVVKKIDGDLIILKNPFKTKG